MIGGGRENELKVAFECRVVDGSNFCAQMPNLFRLTKYANDVHSLHKQDLHKTKHLSSTASIHPD